MYFKTKYRIMWLSAINYSNHREEAILKYAFLHQIVQWRIYSSLLKEEVLIVK